MHKVLKRRKGLATLDLRELWSYRELLGIMMWRDLIVRYKETAVGVLWAFIRPLITMAVFTVLFSKLARLPSDGLPYPVMTFAALLPWQLFSSSFALAGTSITGNSHVISKIYFPRLILPLSSIGVASVDFLICLVVLFGMMIGYGLYPSIHIVWLPAFFFLCIGMSFAAGLWSAALDVKYRDIRHLLPFLMQIGMYVSPVAFSSSVVPARYRLIYSLNPMVGVIEGFRWTLLGTSRTLSVWPVIFSVVVTLILLVSGLFYFKSAERLFADLV